MVNLCTSDRILPLPSPPVFAVVTEPTEVLSRAKWAASWTAIRWWLKYGLKVPDPASANMAPVRAIHSAIGESFVQKVDTREDLPPEGTNISVNETYSGVSSSQASRAPRGLRWCKVSEFIAFNRTYRR
jgi:hypothetical protein